MTKQVLVTYILLLLGLLLVPHVIQGHIFGLSESFAQSVGTILLLLMGYTVYRMHEREVTKKKAEVKKLEGKLDISTEKLNDSYKYIGLVNRKLPLITQVTSDLLARTPENKKEKSAVFVDLLKTATVLANSEWGLFRMLDVHNGKTEKEFIGSQKQYAFLKTQISNKELLACDTLNKKAFHVRDLLVFRSSDTRSQTQSFLVLPKIRDQDIENTSLIQSITDQAQLFYKYIYKK